jgi:hypothetical protein
VRSATFQIGRHPGREIFLRDDLHRPGRIRDEVRTATDHLLASEVDEFDTHLRTHEHCTDGIANDFGVK